ncbi:hypothetical protein GCM10010981_46100 [Dyella nitratireducens]|uniref:Uncharacterized protein n=1 Tax=Dyella nitratireducens TaxID=1849580 RepID=A0ABQ1GXM8_9GAMM|nr:hypothetical protein GCM10010981_46100 [Dyella nitratireducens]GLQ41698.1 hypothetical protein GCM10007902_15480 [Dyella nitratireducens]
MVEDEYPASTALQKYSLVMAAHVIFELLLAAQVGRSDVAATIRCRTSADMDIVLSKCSACVRAESS